MSFPDSVDTVTLTCGPVLDADGNPRAGVKLYAIPAHHVFIAETKLRPGILSAATGADGTASLEVIATDSAGLADITGATVTSFRYRIGLDDISTASSEREVYLPKAHPTVAYEDLVANTAAITPNVLSSTYETRMAARLRAVAQAEYAAATTISESWANLDGVAGSNAVAVSGGTLISSGGAAPNAAKIAWDTTGTIGVAQAVINVPASGYALTMFGVAGDSTSIISNNTDTLMIGISSSGYPAYWWGSAVGGSGAATYNSTALTAGAWLATAVVDEDSVGVTLTSPDGGTVYRVTAPLSGWTSGALHLIAYAGGTGPSVGPVTATKGSLTPRTPAAALPACIYLHKNSTDRWCITTPTGYTPTTPAPLAVFLHNSGGDARTLKDDAAHEQLYDALLAAGYIIATATAGGSTWGNDTGRAAYRALHAYARRHFATTSTVLVAASMGGQVGLQILARGEIPEARALLAVSPVTNLDSLYANASYTAVIETAFGISGDYETKTSGYRPEDRAGWEFASTPTLIITSASDTTCLAADATAIINKMKPYTDARLVTSTGTHLASAQFASAITDGLPFLASYL